MLRDNNSWTGCRQVLYTGYPPQPWRVTVARLSDSPLERDDNRRACSPVLTGFLEDSSMDYLTTIHYRATFNPTANYNRS